MEYMAHLMDLIYYLSAIPINSHIILQYHFLKNYFKFKCINFPMVLFTVKFRANFEECVVVVSFVKFNWCYLGLNCFILVEMDIIKHYFIKIITMEAFDINFNNFLKQLLVIKPFIATAVSTRYYLL
jgi:hypothetical protein